MIGELAGTCVYEATPRGYFLIVKECFDQIGLKPTAKIPLFNGALECEFRKYRNLRRKIQRIQKAGKRRVIKSADLTLQRKKRIQDRRKKRV